MWFRPNNIPGKSIGTRHLPIDQHCDKCHLDYNEVEQKKDEKTGNTTYHCPHCDKEVNLPKEKKSASHRVILSKYRHSRGNYHGIWRK